VSVDEEGLMVEQLPRGVGIIYVTPSHQFPLGVTMSPRRRQALIEYARSHGAVIIEDDYDGEFRYGGGSVEALRNADSADVVFYVGTFSKSMLPALRLGFIVAPAWVMRTLIAAKNCLDWHCSIPIQRAVAGFIADGHLARHIRNLRDTFKERRNLLLEMIQEQCGAWLDPIPSLYGVHIAASAHTSLNLESVSAALLRQNVRMHTLSRYFLGPQLRRGLIFGFGTADAAQIRRGLHLLRRAFHN
jgi:GntR family transcriptional regulator / MocR family aminotransferase